MAGKYVVDIAGKLTRKCKIHNLIVGVLIQIGDLELPGLMVNSG